MSNFKLVLFTASLALATAFTFSCSSDDGDDSTKGSFTDTRDGQKYSTVKIGEQTWMAKNLNFDTDGARCYDDDPANCAKYGRLYDWETAMDNACPNGWHLPNDVDFNAFMKYVHNENESTYYTSGTSLSVGKYLKAKSGWNENGNGEDKYGFTALPGGIGHFDGRFGNIGIRGTWWSSNENDSDNAYYWSMPNRSDVVSWESDNKNFLLSVRCIQDQPAQ
jgi:uncharacterized protein (TIGR02145 family)